MPSGFDFSTEPAVKTARRVKTFSLRRGRFSAKSARVYLEYYGLKQAPFDITPNPRFLFHSAKHREAFNHLLYGIRERKGFVQLTGEVGAGKTTLCRALLEQLDAQFLHRAHFESRF